MTEPTPLELREFFALADRPWPGPTKERFAQLAKAIAPKIETLLARLDAENEALRESRKSKREKVPA